MRVKIIDFGTSRVMASIMTGNLGAPAWIAPEVLMNSKYTEKADIYSFGIVMWELLTSEEPFADIEKWLIPQASLDGKRPPIPKEANKEYVEIMQQCWDGNPENRPSFAVLDMKFSNMLSQINSDGTSK